MTDENGNMAKDSENIVDMTALVAVHLSGAKRFANSKKLNRLGIEEYSRWLEGKLAEKATAQLTDPRRVKRAARGK